MAVEDVGAGAGSYNADPTIIAGNVAVGVDVIQRFLDTNDVPIFNASLGDVFRGRTHTFQEIVEFDLGDARFSAIRTAKFKDSNAEAADVDTADLDEVIFASEDRGVSRKDFPGSRGLLDITLFGETRVAHFSSGDTVYIVVETGAVKPMLTEQFDPDAMVPTPPVSSHS